MTRAAQLLGRRRTGILLHPTSLPGGTLGEDAFRFVDFLHDAGQTVWQTLPLGPTHEDGSPYLALSVHAGGPRLICRPECEARGWLGEDVAQDSDDWLQATCAGFQTHASAEDREAFECFCTEQGHWLDDFALFVAIRQSRQGQAWTDWPVGLRDRQPQALARAGVRLADLVQRVRFEQFCFFRQWHALKRYANERGVLMFGDMPIFVAHDSADVWAHREYFQLDRQGRAKVVAGVPPDYFSETGQRWGNPLYDWDRLKSDGFRWWLERMHTQLALFDLVRIDHFRGFEAYWAIPAKEPTALGGRWVKAPGEALFETLRACFDELPLVAEDLGVITPEVDALRHRFELPGMKILQFAFDGGPQNPYLPHNHQPDYVVYTGTHDNDTTLGWYASLSDETRRYVEAYLGHPAEPMPWALIRCALSSVARLAIIPLQDLLELGNEHRMNRPGTTEGNWQWRFSWEQLRPETIDRLRGLTGLYGRL